MDNNYQRLSKGCQLCQEGKWLCIFITYKCTAGCHFCPAPYNEDRILSSFGNDKDQILQFLKQTNIEGISFSGGDPFLAYERMLDWLVYFKHNLPHYYFWVYTNGLAVNEEKLKKLAKAGMNEIRFNIAATGYLLPEIWENIQQARKYFNQVSIEIPSIEEDFDKLSIALKKASAIGVDFLNLHDYIISDKELRSKNIPYGEFLLNKINVIKFANSSVSNTNDIIRLIQTNKYQIQVNHCSMSKKDNQMLQRRCNMREIFNNEYDHNADEGLVFNYFLFPDSFNNHLIEEILLNSNHEYKNEAYLISKNELEHYKKGSYGTIVQAVYIPKMEVDGNKQLIDWELMNKANR